MKPYEFKRYYDLKFGTFMYKHKGSGIIVDNIFKPLKGIISSVFKNIAKPMAKKAITSGVSHAGEQIGKKSAEKSGDLIMKKLAGFRQKTSKRPTIANVIQNTSPIPNESTHMILNRLISGNGIRTRTRTRKR